MLNKDDIKLKIASLRIPIIILAIVLLIAGVVFQIVFFLPLASFMIIGAIATRNTKKKGEQREKTFLQKIPEGVRAFFSKIIGFFSFICIMIGMLKDSTANTSVLIFGLLGMVVAIWLYTTKDYEPEPAPRQKNTDHGSAAWATQEQIEASGVFQDEGLYVGGECFRSKIGHLLCTAGSRQGKGTCLIIPSLLVDPRGSYVVTDPKGENAFITARHQKEAGQKVYIIDPWDEQTKYGATHGIPSSGFNPFSFLKNDMHELVDNCELVATYLVPESIHAKDPYWNDRARSMIKIFVMHIITAMPEEDHNFWTLYKMLRYSDEKWLKLLLDLRKNEAEDGLISMAAEELIGIEKAANTMAGIRSSAQNATTIFESKQLRQSLAKDDFNPFVLTEGNSTVYVVIPERFLDTHSVWLRLVIGLSLKACNAKPKKRVNFLLDEFAVMGRMKDVQRGYAFASGQNIVLWIFVQSLSQLREIYGEDGMNTFISNAALYQAFGVKDEFTTEYISKLLGEGTFEKEARSFNSSGTDGSYSTTTSLSTYGRRLLTRDEVEKNEGIITFASGLRINIQKLPYYKSLLDHVPEDHESLVFLRKQAEETGKRLEWYDEFKKRADPPPRVVI